MVAEPILPQGALGALVLLGLAAMALAAALRARRDAPRVRVRVRDDRRPRR